MTGIKNMPRPRREKDRLLMFTEACEILLQLHDMGGEAFLQDLIQQARIGRMSIYKYYKKLEEKGLIESEEISPFAKKKIMLTEKGRKIAELLKKIEEIFFT